VRGRQSHYSVGTINGGTTRTASDTLGCGTAWEKNSTGGKTINSKEELFDRHSFGAVSTKSKSRTLVLLFA
jgi:hypothetical protein